MTFDSTSDIYHKNQNSPIIRYVVIDYCEVKVVESFTDFVKTKGKTTEEITNRIFKKLERDGLCIQNCRGQLSSEALS